MVFYRHAYRQEPTRPPNIGRRTVMAVLLVLGCIRILSNAHPNLVMLPGFAPSARPAPVPSIIPVREGNRFGWENPYHFNGVRVFGNGTDLDLGDRHIRLPRSLLSQFFPDEMIIPSCLTETAPSSQQPTKPLPVRDDWPGFYGAPWIGRVNGDLIALLDVYAPRNSTAPLPASEFQIYPDYNGHQSAPAFTIRAPAKMFRGSKAVLYRLFLGGPVTCLDLVVPNGENTGTGYLYYPAYHQYHEVETKFQIEQ